jgi:two-component system LytT family response regulator
VFSIGWRRPCRTDAPLIYRSLAAIEERLNPTMFFRANRSQIVNLRWIESVQTEIDGRLVVHLAKDKRVEISRRQSRKLKELLSL